MTEKSFILENDRLKVTVANCPYGEYDSSRFDWTGFVTGITLDGKYTFESAETYTPEDPMANGVGLCNEFRVPHYAQATPNGQQFLKPGVGLLTQKEGETNWKYDHRYQIEPFEITRTQGKDWVTYHVAAKPWQGILLQQFKTLRLVGNSIVETITLDNRGAEPFSCVVYNHNFVNINNEPLGPEYYIEMPGYSEELLESSITDGNIIVKDGVYTWNEICEKNTRTMTKIGIQTPTSYVWGMYHKGLGLGIREYVDIPYEEFCIWAESHVCTCKVLSPVHVDAGGSATWTRRWEFVEL